MRIAVFANRVLDSECPFVVNEEVQELSEAHVPSQVNPVSLGAIAMLRESFPEDTVKITAICLDPEHAEETVRTCRAHGATSLAIIDCSEFGEPLEFDAKARVAAAFVRVLGIDMVVCSQRDADGAIEGFGPALAEELEWAQISNVCRIEAGASPDSLSVQRKLSHGDREQITCPKAAVLAIDGLMADIVYPSFPCMLASRIVEVDAYTLESLGLKTGDIRSLAPTKRMCFMPPRPRTKRTAEKKSGAAALSAMMGGGQKKKSGGVVEAPPDEAAAQIVSFLEGKGLLE